MQAKIHQNPYSIRAFGHLSRPCSGDKRDVVATKTCLCILSLAPRAMSVLVLALFTYPIWGLALLFLFCRKLAPHGLMARRVLLASAVSALATVIFTPVTWGTEGFALLAPWPVAVVEPEHAAFLWELAAFVFVIAITMSLLSSRASPRHMSNAKRGANPSIERTSQRPLRALWSTALVEPWAPRSNIMFAWRGGDCGWTFGHVASLDRGKEGP